MGTYIDVADEAMYVVILAVLLIEVFFTVSSNDRKSLHDVLCHSRVVLDSKPTKGNTNSSNPKISSVHRIDMTAQETMLQL